MELPEMGHALNHSHGWSARIRSQASLFCSIFAKTVGMSAFYYQKSRHDERLGREGSLEYHWITDLATKPSSFVRKPHQIMVVVDTDEHIDFPKMAACRMQPFILFTFQPGEAAKSKGDYSFSWNDDGTVTYTVNGGFTVRHKVWDYGVDSFVTHRRWCGIRTRTVMYRVALRQMDTNHQLILITPVARWIFPFCYFTSWIEGKELEYLMLVNNGFIEIDPVSHYGVKTSIARVGNFTSCLVDNDKIDHLSEMHEASKVGLTHMQVKSVLRLKSDEECNYSALILNYIRSTVPKKHLVFTGDYTRSYQFKDNRDEFDFDAKPSLVSFMDPLVDGAFAPAQCKGNRQQAVTKRILEIRSNVGMSAIGMRWAGEFTKIFVGNPNGLDPVDYDVVWDRQSRPTQRRILMENDLAYPKDENSAFIKKEAYQNINDPRIISTINGNVKMSYARYIYALDGQLKKCHWYAFGQTPLKIAERVATLCSKASNAAETDFSRYDGRVSQAMRIFERMLMMESFRTLHHSEMLKLMHSQHHLLARMEDESWKGEWERLSGSCETSVFNTIGNAFIAFCTFRSDGKSPQEAWNALGMYAGDDGLTANVDPKRYVRMAARFGHKLTIDIHERGDLGIKFLNRCYSPDVWYGDMNSCCDIMRAVSKFHTTTPMPSTVTPVTKLQDKALAYWLSDRNTPILGEYVTAVVQMMPHTHVFRNLCSKWDARFSEDEQYPNESCSWMDDVLLKQFDPETLGEYFEWLGKPHRTIADFLNPPTIKYIDPTPHKTDAVLVDDMVVEAVVSDVKRKPAPKDRARGLGKKREMPNRPRAAKSHARGPKEQRS
jgi:hypothetical protein